MLNKIGKTILLFVLISLVLLPLSVAQNLDNSKPISDSPKEPQLIQEPQEIPQEINEEESEITSKERPTEANKKSSSSNDKLIEENSTDKLFYHPDHLGSTTLVTNESGDVVELNDTINSRNISMQYDDLNRLAYTSIIDGSQDTTLTFIYNAIGNMLNVTATGTDNVDFYYNNNLAHAPSKVVYY
jgi:hypothetical protein